MNEGMSFEEFSAALNRKSLQEGQQKEREKQKKDSEASKSSKSKNDDPSEREMLKKIGKGSVAFADDSSTSGPPSKEKSAGTPLSLGDFLEMIQTQSLVCVMIVLDTFAAFAEIYLTKEKIIIRAASFEAGKGALLSRAGEITLTTLRSFTSFALIFFAVEILAVLLVFRWSFLGHLGYMTDMTIISSQLYLEVLAGRGSETRLLNILRLWRCARLFTTIVNVEKDLHQQTKDQVEAKDLEIKRMQLHIQTLESDVLKEKEAKDAVEDLLQTYKEEVDTLNEALKIAAMDIAEVAQADDEDLESEEGLGEGTEEDDEGEGSFVDAATSEFDKSLNREKLLRMARKDASASSSATRSQGTTIVINEDGTFLKK
jgi:hypothetical protein